MRSSITFCITCIILLGSKIIKIIFELKKIEFYAGRSLVSGRKETAHVCIVGVWDDLELHSKLNYLLNPLKKTGKFHQVYVSLFLQGGDNGGIFTPYRNPYSFLNSSSSYKEGIYFSKKKISVDFDLYSDPLGSVDGFGNATMSEGARKRLVFENRIKRENQFHSLENVSEFLLSNNLTIGTIDLYSPLVNPPVNAEYVMRLALSDAFTLGSQNQSILTKQGLQRTIWRAVNDVRVLEAYGRCWKAIEARLRYDGNDDTLVILAGEDSFLETSIDVNAMFREDERQEEVVAFPCTTLRGHINDQIVIISSIAIAKSFLTKSYELFYKKFWCENKVCSLSTFLQFLPDLEARATEENYISNAIESSFPLEYNYSSVQPQNKSGILKQGHKKRAFVCITGQLMRLELENKMKTLIRPLLDEGIEVDIALVLGEGKARFQSHKVPRNVSAISFPDPPSVLQWLMEHNISLVSQNVTYKVASNMPVNPQYWIQRAPDSDMSEHVFIKHTNEVILANFLMVESYARCWSNAVASRKTYDLFVRTRDDQGFDTPLDVNVLYELGVFKPARTMITSKFLSNGGINDRIAFVSADSAKCYFTVPIIKLFDGSNLDVAMRNTESYFKRIYWHTDCANSRITDAFNPLKIFDRKFVG